MNPQDKFDQHLEQCERCRNAIFNLCIEGRVLLMDATRAAKDSFGCPWAAADEIETQAW